MDEDILWMGFPQTGHGAIPFKNGLTTGEFCDGGPQIFLTFNQPIKNERKYITWAKGGDELCVLLRAGKKTEGDEQDISSDQ